MSRSLVVAVLFGLAAAGAQAQVYRCAGAKPLYSDRPCAGAAPVDLRANILDAGPRGFPPPPVPQQQLTVLPEPKRQADVGTDASVWGQRDRQDAEFRARTGPF